MAADLAGRGTRLAAALIDAAIWLIGFLPFLIAAFSSESGHGAMSSMLTDPSSIPMFAPPKGAPSSLLILGLILLGCIMLVQFTWLHTRGQSIGKRILGLKIVQVGDGKNGGFVRNVLLRIVLVAAIGFLLLFVPVLGAMLGLTGMVLMALAFVPHLFSLSNVLLIFADDRRCIHDHIAGTQVIRR